MKFVKNIKRAQVEKKKKTKKSQQKNQHLDHMFVSIQIDYKKNLEVMQRGKIIVRNRAEMLNALASFSSVFTLAKN